MYTFYGDYYAYLYVYVVMSDYLYVYIVMCNLWLCIFNFMLKEYEKTYVYMLMGDYILYICLHDTFFRVKNQLKRGIMGMGF